MGRDERLPFSPPLVGPTVSAAIWYKGRSLFVLARMAFRFLADYIQLKILVFLVWRNYVEIVSTEYGLILGKFKYWIKITTKEHEERLGSDLERDTEKSWLRY